MPSDAVEATPSDRVIVVVGGASGIGRACVELAIPSYADITIVDVLPTDEHALPASLAVHYAQVDVTVPGAFSGVVDDVLERTGRIDAVINFVGGAHPVPFLDMTPEAWHDELTFNLTSAFLVSQAAARAMVPRGGGAIVNASSGYGSRAAPPGRAAYSAAKAGLLGFCRTLAWELGPHGVRVNVVSPGPTDTPRFRDLLSDDEIAAVRATTALGQLGTPADSAAAALFLASPEARQITGQILHVNGGAYMPSG